MCEYIYKICISLPHTIAFTNLTMKLLTFFNASDCKLRLRMEFLLGRALGFTFISLLTGDGLKPSPCLGMGGAGRVTGLTAGFCGAVLPGHLTHVVPWSRLPLGICRSC